MPKVRKNMTTWLREREVGRKVYLGFNDKLSHKLYSSLAPSEPWDHTKNHKSAVHGGVFNLEFSPDGSLLIAACEKRSILMFDPLRQRLVAGRDNAHRDCVNCVRFLDSRVFATCSDDSTVALWDARNLKSKIRTFRGHSNWVKNIEFSANDNLLVTSGFDGSIYTWEINSYSENSYKRVFHTNGLMRTRLSPDASKMVICTTGGYIMVIHNLDLNTLAEDLDGFKPNMYRLMQISQTVIPAISRYTDLFSNHRKRNRVEFISDFPEGDEAEVVSSLQIHPQGWCSLSRNITNDESSEWTCVHDIQERERKGSDDVEDISISSSHLMNLRTLNNDAIISSFIDHPGIHGVYESRAAHMDRIILDDMNINDNNDGRNSQNMNVNERPLRSVILSSPISSFGSDVWEAYIAIREARLDRNTTRATERQAHDNRTPNTYLYNRVAETDRRREPLTLNSNFNVRNLAVRRHPAVAPQNPLQSETPVGPSYIHIVPDLYRTRSYGISVVQQQNINPEIHRGIDSETFRNRISRISEGMLENRPESIGQQGGYEAPGAGTVHSTNKRLTFNSKVHRNFKRLTHFIDEPNVGRGFIKELCFSSDGRLICSPYGHGIRLLAFSPECAELSACVPSSSSVRLHELMTLFEHSDIVVSTKFSPQHCLLVSGCLGGKIVWYKPVM